MHIILIFRYLTEDLLQNLGNGWTLVEHDLNSSINRAEVLLTCFDVAGIFRVVAVVSRSGESSYWIEHGPDVLRAYQVSELAEMLRALASDSQNKPRGRIAPSPLMAHTSGKLFRPIR